MMMRLLIVFFVCISTVSWGQKLTATLDHEKILIGEPVTYTLKVELPPRTNIRFDPYQGVIPVKLKMENGSISTEKVDGLEILEEFQDTLFRGKKIDTWEGKFTVTAWDSGSYLLPEPMIVIADSTFYFPSTELRSDLMPVEENVSLYDIKENYADVPDPETWVNVLLRNSWWILLSLAAITFVFIQFRRHANAPKKSAIAKPKLNLKDRTILAIESLEQRKLWEQGDLKKHYVELSYIMRSYLASRYQISLLDKTTIQTRLLLKQEGLHTDTIDVLMTILNQSDMVKFAKSKPDEMSILKVSILAKQIVAETSPIEFDDAE